MNSRLLYIILFVSVCFLLLLEVSVGSVSIPFDAVFRILTGGEVENKSWSVIVLESRLPRSLAALLCGAFLSVSGLLMQTFFRNPLVGPHILGVSAGSSLGVALVVMGAGITGLSQAASHNNFLIVSAAFAGALAVLFVLFLASQRLSDVLTVLILGVLFGAVSMAIVGILQYLSPESQLKAFLVWTLGSFDGVNRSDIAFIALSGLVILIVIFFLLKPLNLMLTGEEYARSMGLNLRPVTALVLLATGGLTAIVTAFCGPIGFVGIVVPHFCRMLLQTFDHRKLFFACLLMGMNVMLIGDLLSHLPGSDLILPVNSITALIGIPFICWMLLKRKFISPV